MKTIDYIIPLVLDSSYLYKCGVLGGRTEKCFDDFYVYIYYDLKQIKNIKKFFYLLDREKYLYNYYFDKYFTVKLCIKKEYSWYIENIYNLGKFSISKIDLLKFYEKEIPAVHNERSGYSFINLLYEI